MQTDEHHFLKWKAIEFLYTYFNCPHVIMEMKVGNYIFDAVGTDGNRVIIIEAKQDINDFKRDCHDPAVILENINKYKNLIHETGELKKYKELIEKERSKSIKFFDQSLMKLASHRYIIAPEDLIQDIPEGWGYVSKYLKIIKECKGNSLESQYANKIIREISKRHTKHYLESQGVIFGKQVIFPERENI